MSQQDGGSLPRLWAVMERLLAPDGCSWDRRQTPESLRHYVLEEAHEVVEAIDLGDPAALCEELGDLLFQVVFLAAIARRRGWFGLDDVVAGIADKLERRHPQVFAPTSSGEATTSPSEAAADWEEIKRLEKGGRPLLGGIPAQLSGLLRAMKVGERAARVGLDFPSPAHARTKVFEELGELDVALADGDPKAAERELGDVLFSVVNWARLHALNAESGLRGSVARFTQRMAALEAICSERGTALSALSGEALDALWEQAKTRAS